MRFTELGGVAVVDLEVDDLRNDFGFLVPDGPTVLRLPELPSDALSVFAPETGQHLMPKASGVLALDVPKVVSSHHGSEALGVDATVVAPPVDVTHLHDAVMSEPTQHHLRRIDATPVVFLTLGAIAPDAHIETILAANNALVTALLPAAQLVVAGPAPVPRYLEVCEFFTRELNTDQTWLAPAPALGEYAAFLRHGTAVINLDTSSRYPREAIEAMSFGVPVIGRVGTVLHELAPDAGVFLKADDGPLVLAEAMFEIARDAELRTVLGRQARRVATIFTSADARAQYVRRLTEVAS